MSGFPITALARITILDVTRRPGYWITGISFIAAGTLSSVPFSPGIVAEPSHYMSAGLSTLLMGGAFLSLMIVPLLLAPGRGNPTGEGILILPLGRGALSAGIFTGFSAALFLYFLVGGSFLWGAAGWSTQGGEPINPFPGVAWALFISLMIAALIFMTSRYLYYAPAIIAAVLVMILGHAVQFLPLPFTLFLPAFSALDPYALGECSWSEMAPAFIHGLAVIALYLTVASLGMRRNLAH